MRPLVVDASVAVKWFLPEIYAEAAERVLKSKRQMLSPDLIWAEVGNVLWKKVRRHEITTEEAGDILKDFLKFPLETYASKVLLSAAWDFAGRAGVSVYDGLYLALATGQHCSLVTADRKLYEKFPKLKLVWVEDIR